MVIRSKLLYFCKKCEKDWWFVGVEDYIVEKKVSVGRIVKVVEADFLEVSEMVEKK